MWPVKPCHLPSTSSSITISYSCTTSGVMRLWTTPNQGKGTTYGLVLYGVVAWCLGAQVVHRHRLCTEHGFLVHHPLAGLLRKRGVAGNVSSATNECACLSRGSSCIPWIRRILASRRIRRRAHHTAHNGRGSGVSQDERRIPAHMPHLSESESMEPINRKRALFRACIAPTSRQSEPRHAADSLARLPGVPVS